MSIELPEKFEKIVVDSSDEWLETRGKTRDELRSFIEKRVLNDREKAPKVGEDAPDFVAERLDDFGKRTGEMVKLSSNFGSPIGLIFGSYTWPPFRDGAVRLDNLAKSYGDKVTLFSVYIREAHAEGEDQVPRNLDEDVIFEQPATSDERAEVAAACMLRHNFSFPMLMDNMENEAEEKYMSWPDRLYLIDSDGKIAYQGGMGPLYFDVDEFEQELRNLLGD
jgi:hypothetical protein